MKSTIMLVLFSLCSAAAMAQEVPDHVGVLVAVRAEMEHLGTGKVAVGFADALGIETEAAAEELDVQVTSRRDALLCDFGQHACTLAQGLDSFILVHEVDASEGQLFVKLGIFDRDGPKAYMGYRMIFEDGKWAVAERIPLVRG